MIMPFGKHKGVDLEDLPDSYLRWLDELDDLREPLRTAVRDERARRTGQDFSQPPELRGFGNAERQVARRIVEAGRRSLAKAEHPDHGGELATMQRVNVVADTLLALIAENPH